MDLNADGFADILSGSYSREGQSADDMAGLFQVLWGNADGTFKKAAALNGTDKQPLTIPRKTQQDLQNTICTRPFAVDWDADGDLDLVVGVMSGKFFLFTGEGNGKFAPTPTLIKAGSKELCMGTHGDPFVIDWDGDGDLDLLSGSSNSDIAWAENTAGPKSTPILKPFVHLIKSDGSAFRETRPHEVVKPLMGTRVWAGDVNGDGKVDLLVGDHSTLISPAAGISEEELARRYEQWKADYHAAGELAMSDQKAYHRRMAELREQRKQFISEEHTGFVWLYLRN